MGERLAYTVPEVADRLGVPAKTVYWWCEQGILPHLKAARRVLIPAAALQAWIAERTQVAAAAPPAAPVPVPMPHRRPRRRRVL